MSTKVIGFPSNPAVDDEYQGWVWDGDKWVSDAVKGGLWEQNGDDIYYNDGNVGIGMDSPNRRLTVNNNSGSIVTAQYNRDNTAGGGTANIIYQYSNDGVGRLVYEVDDFGTQNRIQSTNDIEIQTDAGQEIRFNTNGRNTRLTINDAGNVGIGMAPANFDLSAKEQLAEWKAKAKKASWEIVTDGEFSQEPTEDLVSQWIETRAAGDKLQVAGNISATGTVDAAGFTINGVPISGGGGLPDGDFTHNGVITATDFIAKSDERLKTGIAPMPVGLIDDIKPVSWDWIDGGGKSAGVVAQQLQEIGLGDYVHENEDGELGVNYQALTAILLAEVIALKKAIK
jgi:hypothetical protein